MKALWLKLLLLILVLTIPVSAEIIDIIEFDQDSLRIDPDRKSVRYDDFDLIQDKDRPSVPYERVHYYLDGKTGDLEFTGIILSADTIELGFSPEPNAADMITSDFALDVEQKDILQAEKSCFPDKPMLITEQVIKGQTVWSMVIFPVQYLDSGRVIFNRKIGISEAGGNGGLPIMRGLPEYSLGSGPVAAYGKVLSPSGENGCPLGHQYVVVTSPLLAEAFDSFLDLKRQTGFDAMLAVTDSIYTHYSGIDPAEKVRNYLRDFYNSGGEYVLLGGDENHVPVRYAYFYNTDITPELDQSMICDLYFADYDGDWDADGDGVWGEPAADLPDIGVEVSLGRLPFKEPDQIGAYTGKLRNYLFNPGGGERQYLDRTVFIVSDQMRDYFEEGGQQYYVAENIPADYEADLERLAEAPTGDAASPTGPFPPETISGLDEGYGIVNVLAHGRPDGFILNSSEYNLYPKSYLLTGPEHVGTNAFDDLAPSQKIGFYYSIACSQASIDLESVYSMQVPSVVEKLLELDSAGAVGFIGFSRWGWVGSSYKLMASFYAHLFGEADGYPAEAMYRTYLDYPYYVDQIYGQNYYGDPSVRLYLDAPPVMTITASNYYEPAEDLTCQISLGGQPVAGQPVTVRIGSEPYQTTFSDGEGYVSISLPEKCTETVEITAFEPGMVSSSVVVYPSIAADVDDDGWPLPEKFELHQNYPNPFNPATTISFNLTRHQSVTLSVYDILGRLIDQPVDQPLDAGEHQILWSGLDRDGDELPSGIYFYRLESAEGMEVKKMMLLR